MIEPWWIEGICGPGLVAGPQSPSVTPLGVSHTHRDPWGMRPPWEEEDFPLCKPFILFQGCLSPTVHHSLCSFYCCLAETPAAGGPCGGMCATKSRHEQWSCHIFMPSSTSVEMCPLVFFASQVLTCGVALHLDDTFRLLAGFPGIEGPNPNSDFNRRSRHVCGAELSPLLKFLVCLS